ncbi:MAG: transposase [Thermoguttaceae bacterium]
MDQLTPSLLVLLDPFATVFRVEVFEMFRLMVGAWIVCLGRRTISRVWETTGQSETRNHASAFRLFSAAAWNWDEVCRVLILAVVTRFVPGIRIWVVVDDTLCHKRGAKVAFGGIFLDAVLSTKKHKVFRFGNNWVLLGIVVQLPFRKDRYFSLAGLWRVYEKRGKKSRAQHRTKSQLAAELVNQVARWFPTRKIQVVDDCAYVGQHLLQGREPNVEVIGPIRWDAALTTPVPPDAKKGRKKGDRLPTPAQILANYDRWPAQDVTLKFPKGKRRLLVKVVKDVCWYQANGPQCVQLILVRDPEGKWRNEALLSTDDTLTPGQVITGYCRRWSVEVAFCDAKQMLGFHDPQVWCEKSIERAAPMSWFVGSLVVLWYAITGHQSEQARRHRPWYKNKPKPTFADMLAACRLHLWRHWLANGCASHADKAVKWEWLLEYLATSA